MITFLQMVFVIVIKYIFVHVTGIVFNYIFRAFCNSLVVTHGSQKPKARGLPSLPQSRKCGNKTPVCNLTKLFTLSLPTNLKTHEYHIFSNTELVKKVHSLPLTFENLVYVLNPNCTSIIVILIKFLQYESNFFFKLFNPCTNYFQITYKYHYLRPM